MSLTIIGRFWQASIAARYSTINTTHIGYALGMSYTSLGILEAPNHASTEIRSVVSIDMADTISIIYTFK